MGDRPRQIPDAAKAGGEDRFQKFRSQKSGDRPRKASDGADAKKPLPDALMRLLVDEAVNANDYESLSVLMGKLDRIGDPEIRLRLLEGLTWFDETAVADSLPFLVDTDERVASTAAEVVSSRISSVERSTQREKLYSAALKLMPDDLADRDILLATLENDKKSVVIRVLHDLEGTKTADPELWRKLKEVYRTACGRPYVSHLDALLHYDSRADP